MLQGLAEQAEWPQVSEWVVLESARMRVLRTADGTRILEMWTQGNRRGYRLPMPALSAAVVAKELAGGDAIVPGEDAGAHHAPAPFEPLPTDDAPVEDTPQPPTMGQ